MPNPGEQAPPSKPLGNWRWYKSDAGSDVVRDEIKELLPRDAETAIRVAMNRYRDGHHLPREHKNLGKGLHELKVDHEGATFRLYFAVVGPGIPLALHAAAKTSRQDQNRAMVLAYKRLAEWLARHRNRRP